MGLISNRPHNHSGASLNKVHLKKTHLTNHVEVDQFCHFILLIHVNPLSNQFRNSLISSFVGAFDRRLTPKAKKIRRSSRTPSSFGRKQRAFVPASGDFAPNGDDQVMTFFGA